MLKTFLADAVGGIAAVGEKPNLLPHLIHRMGERSHRCYRQFRAVRLAAGRIGASMKIQHSVIPAMVEGS